MISDWRILFVVCAVFAAALVAVVAWVDRTTILVRAEEATSTRARLIAAHGDAALGEASQVALALLPEVEAWDFADDATGVELHSRLQRLVVSSPRLVAAWVVDAVGITRLYTWGYPSDPIDVTDRVYFQRHLAGERDPVIAGSETGSVTGAPRSTFSVSVRDETGEIKGLIVVAAHTSSFETLYNELTREAGTSAGFYKLRGDNLAESASAAEADLRTLVIEAPAVRDIGKGETVQFRTPDGKVVSVRSSGEYPGIIAASAADVSGALAAWRTRLGLLGLAATAIVALTALLSRSAARVRAEQEARQRLEFASHEVQHRMRNSLALIGSFIRLRARGAEHPETKRELALISNQLTSLSKIQSLLDVNEEPGAVDVVVVLEHLCAQIEATHGVTLARTLGEHRLMESGKVGRVAIVLNELVTNAIKHGDGLVRVTVASTADGFEMTVENEGRPLSPGFSLAAQTGFGLNAMATIAESMGGELTADPEGALGGPVFRLWLPAGDRATASVAT